MKSILRAGILGLALTLAMVMAGCGERNILEEKLKNQDSFFILGYSHSFAERFALPVAKAVATTPGLQAMALEFYRYEPIYNCRLHLYVDADLDLYFPDGGQDHTAMQFKDIFFGNSNGSDEDHHWNSEQVDKSNRRMMFRSTNPSHFVHGMGYVRVRRQFLPGLTLISLRTMCNAYEEANLPAEIWIQKAEVGDYFLLDDDAVNPNRENNYRFEIPPKLARHVAPYVEAYNEAWRRNEKGIFARSDSGPRFEIP